MHTEINFYSVTEGEIQKFLDLYYSKNVNIDNGLFWEKKFEDPITMIDIMTCFIDNSDRFNANLWISLDKDIFICVTENNLDSIIRYIYERYPY